jgi:hypothetical protein
MASIRKDFANGLVARELIADVLPDETAGTIAAMIEQGLAVMKKALER